MLNLFAWTKPFYGREALLCLPAMPLLLWASLWLGDEVQGAIAAGAAFSVGFGASRGLCGRRWGAMLAATLGISVAAMLGSLVGHWLWLLLLCGGIAAAVCAVLGLLDDALWWVALQVCIALFVAGYFPGSWDAALDRAMLTFAGGAAQMACVITLAHFFPSAAAPLPSGPPKAPATHHRLRTHGLRAALGVVLALAVAHALGLANSYWAPMTALLVLKPGLLETRTRGGARLLGTVVGCGVATLFVVAVDAQKVPLLLALAATAAAAFALQKAHYATLTTAVTATVVLLISLGSADVVASAEHRLLATLLGGLLALGVAWVLPQRRVGRVRLF